MRTKYKATMPRCEGYALTFIQVSLDFVRRQTGVNPAVNKSLDLIKNYLCACEALLCVLVNRAKYV